MQACTETSAQGGDFHSADRWKRSRLRSPPPRCTAPGSPAGYRAGWSGPALEHDLAPRWPRHSRNARPARSEEHTSELQSLRHLVCRLLLEKKKQLVLPNASSGFMLSECSEMGTAVRD